MAHRWAAGAPTQVVFLLSNLEEPCSLCHKDVQDVQEYLTALDDAEARG